MIIRKWRTEDNLQISKLEKMCFSNPWNYTMICDMALRDDFLGLVGTIDKKIICYVACTFLFEEAEINILATDIKYRQRGYAINIMEKCFEKLRKQEIKKVFLEVRSSNNKAINLYQKLGFVYVNTRRNYYEGIEDALVMLKLL